MNRGRISSLWIRGLLGMFMALAGHAALAQGYPSKPIRFIIPFAPGGTTDIVARLVGQKLTEAWGQGVVVESRPGANGIIASEVTKNAAPDGHTMFMAVLSTHATNPFLYSKLPYDPIKDFTPVVGLSTTGLAVVVHPSVPAKTMPELLAYLRANPGKVNYSAGTATVHMVGELLKSLAHVDINAVPYKGTAPGLMAVVSGEVAFTFEPLITAIPQMKAGRVRALAVGSPKRSQLVPDLPTVAESGVPGFDGYSWLAIVMPAGVPKEIATKMQNEVLRILELPDVKEKMLAGGLEPMPLTGEQLSQLFKSEMAKWGKVIKQAGIKLD